MTFKWLPNALTIARCVFALLCLGGIVQALKVQDLIMIVPEDAVSAESGDCEVKGTEALQRNGPSCTRSILECPRTWRTEQVR